MKKFLLLSFMFCPVALFAVILMAINPIQAFEPGKTYDQSNYQEIKDLLAPPILNWVKNGDFVLPTGKLEFKWEMSESYEALGRKNEGKFDFDNDGIMIEKATGNPPTYFLGTPFPTIDEKDPKVGQKIMENQRAKSYYISNIQMGGDMNWVNEGGKYRSLSTLACNEYYYNRWLRGPIPNPDGYQMQQLMWVVAPFDLRGATTLFNIFIDNRTDVNFSYVPMLRRAIRVSAAARSDPFFGTDMTSDDGHGFSGKPASFTWKFIERKTLLEPNYALKPNKAAVWPDGGVEMLQMLCEFGYETPGWKGAQWAPTTHIYWVPREVLIIEGTPQDPYYNYGRIILYLDEKIWTVFLKEMYDKAGEYWKTGLFMYAAEQDANGEMWPTIMAGVTMVDDRARHATTTTDYNPDTPRIGFNFPYGVTGPYTRAGMIQMSK